jgi:hypothetical protein
MIIKLGAVASEGQDRVHFRVRVPQDQMLKTLSASITEISSSWADEDDDGVVLASDVKLGSQTLRVDLDYEEDISTATFKVMNFSADTFDRLQKKIRHHERDKVETQFGFLREKPSIVFTPNASDLRTEVFLVLPPRSLYLADFMHLFPVLNFDIAPTEYVMDGKSWYGYENASYDTKTYHSSGIVAPGSAINTVLEDSYDYDPSDVPKEVKFYVSMLDSYATVEYPPGDGTFSSYVAQLKNVFDSLLDTLNVSRGTVVISAGDDKKIKLHHQTSKDEVHFTLTFNITSELETPTLITFLPGENTIVFRERGVLESSAWLLKEKKRDELLLEKSFPLTILITSHDPPLGFVYGHGIDSIAAAIDRKGRVMAEPFTMPNNQSLLTMKFLHNSGKVYIFPRAMNIYATLRVL